MTFRLRNALFLPNALVRPAYPLGRFFANRLDRRAARAMPRDFVYPPPRTVILEPTLRCNRRCAFCFQHDQRPGDPVELTVTQVHSLLSGLAPARLKLIGGEVFLRDDAMELIAAASNACRNLSIVTNGSLLNRETAGVLARLANLERFSVSMVPDEKAENPFTPHLEAVAPYTRMLARRVPMLAQVVIRHDNAPQILRALPALRAAGFRKLLLMLEMTCTESQRRRSVRLLGAKTELEESGLLFVRVREEAPAPEALSDAVRQVRRGATAKGIFAFPELPMGKRRIARFCQGSEPADARVACRYLLEPTLRIDPEGNAVFCEHIRRPLGNLLEKSVEEIWNGAPMVGLRRLLFESGYLPACRRCCKFVHLS